MRVVTRFLGRARLCDGTTANAPKLGIIGASGRLTHTKGTETMKKLASITLSMATIFVLAALFSAPLVALLVQ